MQKTGMRHAGRRWLLAFGLLLSALGAQAQAMSTVITDLAGRTIPLPA